MEYDDQSNVKSGASDNLALWLSRGVFLLIVVVVALIVGICLDMAIN